MNNRPCFDSLGPSSLGQNLPVLGLGLSIEVSCASSPSLLGALLRGPLCQLMRLRFSKGSF